MYLQISCEAETLFVTRITEQQNPLLKHRNLSPRKTSSQNVKSIFELVLSQKDKPISMKKIEA